MERRFEIQKWKILKEADIKPQVFNGMLKRLEKFVKPFIACLGRHEPKENAHIYISGLLTTRPVINSSFSAILCIIRNKTISTSDFLQSQQEVTGSSPVSPSFEQFWKCFCEEQLQMRPRQWLFLRLLCPCQTATHTYQNP